jgi:hypothetical protein
LCASFLIDFSPVLFLLLLGVGPVPVQRYLGAEQARCGE